MMLSLASILAALLLTGQPRAGAPAEQVVVRNGDVQLAGTLTFPEAADRSRRLPAVVLLGGSGPAPRTGVQPFAEQLVRLGLVTLACDKRGSGQSTGDWTDASLDDLAEDAAAMLRFLAARPEVDPARVGVWGVSQAGWVIPLLASKSPAPAFSIVVTGGGATPREVEMFGYRQALGAGGASADDRVRAGALLNRYFDWLGTGRDRPGLLAEIEKSKGESWFRFVPIDRVLPGDASRPKWAWVASFDPARSIAGMRSPTLVILGSGDPLGPAGVSATRWREALARGGNADAQVEVFDDMGHAARQGGGHNASSPISPSYTASVEAFIARYVMRR